MGANVRPRILQTTGVLASLQEQLTATYDCHVLSQQADPKAFLAGQGAGFDALVTSGKAGADAALVDALPNLKVAAHFGVGYDAVDVDHIKRRGIPFSNTPDVLNDCVADLAMGLVIDAARGMSASDRFVRRGEWLKGQFPLATRVSGKRMGILGLGRIGQTIARRATGFDMEIRYHSRNKVAGVAWGYEPSLEELARWCDFLIVVVAGGAATRHLVSARVLDALGPNGYIVNVSRGTVIDEAALVKALVEKRIAGAGLDVFDDEPTVPTELMALDNVVLLPHIGSATHDTRKAMGDLVFANLQAFFANGRLLTPV